MEDLIAKAADFARVGVLAAFGATAKYLYDTQNKDRVFTWGAFFANIFIAFFAGKLAGEFISPDNAYRDGFIMVTGFCSYPFLAWIEIKFKKKLEEL